MPLTGKQATFLAEYLRCWNASEAARRAGYSVHTAGAIGSENLKKPEILAAIERFKAEHIMSAEEVQILVTQQARSDIGDFLEQADGVVRVDLVKAIEAKKTGLIKKLSQTRTVRTRGDDDVEESVSTTIELYDKQAALVQIGKMHKIFSERQEVVGKDGGPVVIKVVYGNGSDSKTA